MNIKYAIQGDIGRESAQNILAVSSQLARSLEGQTTIKTIEIDSAKAIIKVNVDTAFIVIIVSALTGVIFHPRSGSIEMLPYTEYVSGPFGSMPETKYLPGVAGGWRDGKTELTTEYIYPLVDEDNASFLISKEDDKEELLGEFLGENGNYGNLYWWNGDEEEPVFLSWKGTPTRHFRLPNNIEIPGFSTFETSSPGMIEDTPIYTAFGTKLYQDGAVLAEAPEFSWPYNPSGIGNRCLVLGVCINKHDGKTYMVALSDRKNAPEYFAVFSDGHTVTTEDAKNKYLFDNNEVKVTFERQLSSPGFYLTLWKQGSQFQGWDFISEYAYSNSGLPFFANSDGTAFTDPNGLHITIEGSVSVQPVVKGVYSEEGPYHILSTDANGIPAGTKIYDVNHLTFSADYSNKAFWEYSGLLDAFSLVKTDVDTYSDNTSETTIKKSHATFGIVLNPELHVLSNLVVPAKNASNDGFVVGGEFSVDWIYGNVYCDTRVTWSVPGTSLEPLNDKNTRMRVISSSGLCNLVTVSASLFGETISTSILFAYKWVLGDYINLGKPPVPPCWSSGIGLTGYLTDPTSGTAHYIFNWNGTHGSWRTYCTSCSTNVLSSSTKLYTSSGASYLIEQLGMGYCAGGGPLAQGFFVYDGYQEYFRVCPSDPRTAVALP